MPAFERFNCPMCGTWECNTCGNKAQRRNRAYPFQHRCPKCGSVYGQMLPIRHIGRVRAEDDRLCAEDYRALGQAFRYPLEEE